MDVLNITKITLTWELFEAGMPKSHIASRLGLQRETVHLWIKGILEYGLVKFLDKFKAKVYEYTDKFRVARPYKKNEQI